MTQETETQILTELRGISNRLETVETRIGHVETQITDLSDSNEKFNDKLTTYQQGMQWVVQLSFSLIAAATVVTLASAIFKR
jgi:peptidoglycan hydrolase CwlO-like protein